MGGSRGSYGERGACDIECRRDPSLSRGLRAAAKRLGATQSVVPVLVDSEVTTRCRGAGACPVVDCRRSGVQAAAQDKSRAPRMVISGVAWREQIEVVCSNEIRSGYLCAKCPPVLLMNHCKAHVGKQKVPWVLTPALLHRDKLASSVACRRL